MKKIMIRAIDWIAVILLSLVIWVMKRPNPVVSLARRSFFKITVDTRPISFVKDGVPVTISIEFPSEHLNNKFDYFEAVNAHAGNPIILWVHGGGFIGGNRIDIEEYAVELAKKGYHVIVIGYELAPVATYPAPVIQLGELLEFLQQEKGNWDFNLDNLFFAGDSAGAQIASQFTMIQTNPAYADLMEINPVINARQISGMLLFCGAFDIEGLTKSDSRLINFVFSNIGWAYLGEKNWMGSDLANSASIIKHVNKDFPSSYITDGNTMSFEDQGKDLVARLESFGVKVRSRFFDIDEFETKHVFHFDLEHEASKLVFEDVISFLGAFRK